MVERYKYLRDRMQGWDQRLEWTWFLILLGGALLFAALSDKGFFATLLNEARTLLQVG